MRHARTCIVLTIVVLAALVGAAPEAAAQGLRVEVQFTNLSQQIISPPILVSHSFRTRLFRPGAPASPGLAAVAEDAVPDTLLDELAADDEVLEVVVAGGMLMPGATTTLEIGIDPRHDRVSAVGMLVTTNDAFFGLDNLIVGPGRPFVQHVEVPAYDAGSEVDNEDCEFIPGPPCGNAGVRATEGAEGRILIHSGIHGVGDLAPSEWNWHNPVLRVTAVRR